jgi:hypothetical protein
VAVRYDFITVDPDCKVEYREAIASASVIPSLIKWLESNRHTCAMVQLISELANRGERQLDTIVSQLIWISKSSIVNPLQA